MGYDSGGVASLRMRLLAACPGPQLEDSEPRAPASWKFVRAAGGPVTGHIISSGICNHNDTLEFEAY